MTPAVTRRAIPPPYALPFVYRYRKLTGTLDRLVARLPTLVKRRGRAIDIGANEGMFTVALAALATHVESFEPQLEYVAALRDYAGRKGSSVSIHQCALSDAAGMMEIRIPVSRGRRGAPYLMGGLATLSSRDLTEYDAVVTREVPIARLDDFGFSDVSFVKIDVEGHEPRVIAGAIETIRRNRPTLLVEVEDRHLEGTTVRDVIATIEALGYQGYFFDHERLVRAEAFDTRVHQAPYLEDVDAASEAGLYINNFVFIPRGLPC